MLTFLFGIILLVLGFKLGIEIISDYLYTNQKITFSTYKYINNIKNWIEIFKQL